MQTFFDMENQANSEYQKFLLAILHVEKILGVANTSKTKSLSYQALQKLDEEIDNHGILEPTIKINEN